MYKRAWGKFSPPSNDRVCAEWHPLVDHCADVAATLGALLRETLLGERLLLPAGLPLGDERLIQRLAAIAFLHDLGKANRGFQNKIRAANARDNVRPETAGHVRELWPLLSSPDLQSRLSEASPIEALSGWIESCAFFPLVASVSHHGTP